VPAFIVSDLAADEPTFASTFRISVDATVGSTIAAAVDGSVAAPVVATALSPNSAASVCAYDPTTARAFESTFDTAK